MSGKLWGGIALTLLVATLLGVWAIFESASVANFLPSIPLSRSLEDYRSLVTLIQGIVVTVGVFISVHLFADGARKRAIDRKHASLSLLTVTSSGTAFRSNSSTAFAIDLSFENVGLQNVKLWHARLVDVVLFFDCEYEKSKEIKEKIQTAVDVPLQNSIRHWRMPAFGIRTNEEYTQSLWGRIDMAVGPFGCKFEIYFDHDERDHSKLFCEVDERFSAVSPIDIRKLDPRRQQRPWFSETYVLLKPEPAEQKSNGSVTAHPN